MALQYQNYKFATPDPAAGMTAALAPVSAGVKGTIDGIKSMFDIQSNAIKTANTQQATDLLKQKIQQEGLGILAKPIDQEQFLRPFGNVDKEAVAKTVIDFTDRLKNAHLNQYSAEADTILAETGDPIKAREHVKQRFLAAGAPAPLGDVVAGEYDLRKATEIKNIGIRRQQDLDTGLAVVGDAAQQGGYAAGIDQARNFVHKLPKYEQAAALKEITGKLNEAAKPDEQTKNLITNSMTAFDEGTKLGYESRSANLDQKNKQTYSTSNSIGADSGVSSQGGKGKSDKSTGGPTLINDKGKVNPTVANALGSHVNNFVEKLSRTSDAAMIKALHRDIVNNVDSEDAAASILGQAFSAAYKGDSWAGNDLSAKDIEVMKARAKVLIEAQNSQSTGGGVSHSSSSSRSGNISFTNADELNAWINNRQKERQLFYESLTTAARDDALGFKGNTNSTNPSPPNRITQVLEKFRNQQAIPTATVKSKENVIPVIKSNAGNAVQKINKPTTESMDSRIARQLSIDNERKAKAAAATVQPVPTPATADLTPQEITARNFATLEAQRVANIAAVKNLKEATKSAGTSDIHADDVKVVSPRSPGGWAWAKPADVIRYKLTRYTK